MLQALLECKQTGAADILQSIEAKELNFGDFFIADIAKTLNQTLSYEEIQFLHRTLKEKVQQENLQKFSTETIANGREIVLVKETIPDIPLYYISRFLYSVCFRMLKPGLFTKNCKDVFVFRGIGQPHLFRLTNDTTISGSNYQLRGLTTRHILLEQEADWEVIQKISTAPTHLVDYVPENDTFFLQDTTEFSAIIQENIEFPGEDKNRVPETKFLQFAQKNGGSLVRICDVIGMGKTLLLANLARLAREQKTNLVAFFQLSNFSMKMPLTNDYDTAQAGLELILDRVSTSLITKLILQELVVSNAVTMDLFFDGLDDVHPKDWDSLKALFTFLCKNQNIRVFVTSRVHTRVELGHTGSVYFYDIGPFTEKQQVEFLTKFWKLQEPTSDQEKLNEFASLCLDNLKGLINTDEHKITGVPRTCRVLAEVYANDASIYAQPNRKITASSYIQDEFGPAKFFEKYMELRLGKTECDFVCLVNGDSHSCSLACKAKSFHVWFAVNKFFPELGSKIGKITTRPSATTSGGIVWDEFEDMIGDSLVDLRHRQCADYLMAELVSKFIQPLQTHDIVAWLNCRSRIFEYVIENLLQTTKEFQDLLNKPWDIKLEIPEKPFVNHACVYFLESELNNRRQDNLAHAISNRGCIQNTSNSLHAINFQVLHACLRLNYHNIIKNLKVWLMSKFSSCNASQYYFSTQLGHQIFLVLTYTASKYSKRAVFEEFVGFLQDCYEVDFWKLVNSVSATTNTPLHVAIQSENFELVSYLLKYICVRGRDFLCCCVKGNRNDGYYLANDRVDICKLMLCNSVIAEKEAQINSNKTYFEVVRFLIEMGADLDMTFVVHNKHGEPKFLYQMWHLLADFLAADDFIMLHRFIVDKELYTCPNPSNMLLFLLRHGKPDPDPKRFADKIKRLMDLPGICINDTDSHGYNGFLAALYGKRGIDVLILLAKWGANVRAKTAKEESAFHLVSKFNDMKVVEYLANLHLPLNAQNLKGYTPIAKALKRGNLEMVKYFEEIHATLSDVSTLQKNWNVLRICSYFS